jgi:hypothetical protein
MVPTYLGASPMDDKEIIANHRFSLMSLAMVAASLEDFASQIIRRVLAGGALNDETFASIKTTCIINLKNSQASGLPIETEAQAFRKALSDLEQFMNGAIFKARNAQKS